MIERYGNRFNCCESVILRVNDEIPIDSFCKGVMKAASNLGGGVSGWGSACGAISGAAMSFGLLIGTEGTENPEDFSENRSMMREKTQEFLKAFEEKWGYVNCFDLLGVDFRTEEGRKIYEEKKAKGENHCEEYVKWAADKVIELYQKD
jgi:C_GCAxxG_C_C family probable redox protein